ncbi:hypothetical protein ACM3VC_005025 [Escherichia coli]|nr:hypothetical protein [Escherichia coli]EFG8528668.1 hypothetical protein [Escherichia coli]EFJ1429569.1 hypothetical protein [Escherichia coli]EFN0939111.1 hypothetical protein [Escherichia coli]
MQKREIVTLILPVYEKVFSRVTYQHTIDKVEQITASVNELSAEKISQLMPKHPVINVHMWVGHWKREIYIPEASNENKGRILTINHEASYNSNLHINDGINRVPKRYMKSFTSDGKTWK